MEKSVHRSERRIAAQLEKTRPPYGRWLAGGSLPPEMAADAARRLGVLGLLMAGIFALFFALFYPSKMRHLANMRLASFPIVGVGVGVAASLSVFVLSRRCRGDAHLLFNLGGMYQILIAFIVGLLSHLGSWELTTRARGWSGVAVWLIIYTIIVPAAPRRTAVLATLCALMDPLALLLTVGLGNPVPPVRLLPQMFLPTFVAVIVAVITSRISFRLGRDVHQARELGSYRLVEPLGKGGMGEVWRAEHKLLARPAAIKLVRPDTLGRAKGDAELVLRRFEREAQATALLESPHTIQVYDFGITTDGSFYYVMELLDGLDLDELVRRFGPVAPERAIHILVQVCDSLAEAHSVGLIHRDIKPSNIYVCRKALIYDFVKVLDFGLVKQTQEGPLDKTKLTLDGSLSGTPAFMVPEIIQGSEHVDARADLYALGCVGYWLLSGKLVFEDENVIQMILKHANAAPVSLSQCSAFPIPKTLEHTIHSCLEKDPSRRPPSAGELAARFRAVALDTPWTQDRARDWWRGKAANATRGTANPFEDTATSPASVSPKS